MKKLFLIFLTAALLPGCRPALEKPMPGAPVAPAEMPVTTEPAGKDEPAPSEYPPPEDVPAPSEYPPPEDVPAPSEEPPVENGPAPAEEPPMEDEPAPAEEHPDADVFSVSPAIAEASAMAVAPELKKPPVARGASVEATADEDESAFFIRDRSDLSNAKKSWYFNRNANHEPPTAQREIDVSLYGGYYLGDTGEKCVYLTFDEGYENGHTGPILDVLLEKRVPAAFFLTKSYIKSEPDLVRRMADEGHVAGNHSVSHPSFPSLTDEEAEYELAETARYFQEITGEKMPRYFRPPMGEYSERTLALANDLGYKTIFWSFAYKDWLTDQQPGRDAAYKAVMDGLHPGAVILLHAVSKSNTEALPDIIDDIRAQGYTFKSLDELPELE